MHHAQSPLAVVPANLDGPAIRVLLRPVRGLDISLPIRLALVEYVIHVVGDETAVDLGLLVARAEPHARVIGAADARARVSFRSAGAQRAQVLLALDEVLALLDGAFDIAWLVAADGALFHAVSVAEAE